MATADSSRLLLLFGTSFLCECIAAEMIYRPSKIDTQIYASHGRRQSNCSTYINRYKSVEWHRFPLPWASLFENIFSANSTFLWTKDPKKSHEKPKIAGARKGLNLIHYSTKKINEETQTMTQADYFVTRLSHWRLVQIQWARTNEELTLNPNSHS